MRGIACEDHPALDEALHHPAGEGIDTGPLVFPGGGGAEHLAQTAVDVFRLLLLLRIGIAAELEVHAQHVVGLAVQQHGIGRVERRIEPEAPLLRQLAGETDVSDQELVVKDLPGERQPEQVSHRAAHAIAGDQPFGVQRVAPVRRLDFDLNRLKAWSHTHDLVAEPAFDQRLGEAAVVEILLDVVLLQVHEGGELVAGFRRQIEVIDRLVAEIDFALLPGDPLVDHAPGDAETVPGFEAVPGLADRTASEAHAVVVVEEDNRKTAGRQRQRTRWPGNARTHDHDRPAFASTVELCRPAIGIAAVCVRTHRPDLVSTSVTRERDHDFSSAAHISMSRSAVQMRGWSRPLASS